ncbi:MAG: hypothetical protein JNJ57_10160 [Saprospiraceae bacterium]|nr:hypothetical protein [Saprospiraceae bacterium]
MKRIGAFLLLTMMLYQSFYNLGVVVYWFGNHAYIAAVLCENRDKPEEHCDGKCYLKKNLSAAPDQPSESKSTAPVLKKDAELIFLLDDAFSWATFSLEDSNVPVRSVVHQLYNRLADLGVFHPPRGC